MTSIKDQLKSSQQGSGNSFPKLNISLRIELKESPNGAVFNHYDKEAKENLPVSAPLKGILIGTAMIGNSYSDDLGNKGGNYQTDFYCSNKNMVLFAPTNKGYERICHGAIADIEAFLNSNKAPQLKKKQVLFVLSAAGLLAIITNLSISIDQLTTYKEAVLEKYIILNPKTFVENVTDITKKGKEYLGKFRQKNPPKYASISIGEDISEKDFNEWDAEKVIEEFKLWKEFKLNGSVSGENTSFPPETLFIEDQH